VTPLNPRASGGLSGAGASGLEGRVGRGFGNPEQELLGVRLNQHLLWI